MLKPHASPAGGVALGPEADGAVRDTPAVPDSRAKAGGGGVGFVPFPGDGPGTPFPRTSPRVDVSDLPQHQVGPVTRPLEEFHSHTDPVFLAHLLRKGLTLEEAALFFP